jgi:hypothetical protein
VYSGTIGPLVRRRLPVADQHRPRAPDQPERSDAPARRHHRAESGDQRRLAGAAGRVDHRRVAERHHAVDQPLLRAGHHAREPRERRPAPLARPHVRPHQLQHPFPRHALVPALGAERRQRLDRLLLVVAAGEVHPLPVDVADDVPADQLDRELGVEPERRAPDLRRGHPEAERRPVEPPPLLRRADLDVAGARHSTRPPVRGSAYPSRPRWMRSVAACATWRA